MVTTITINYTILIFTIFSFVVGTVPYGLHTFIMFHVIGYVTNCHTLFVLHVTHTFAYLSLRLAETISPVIYMNGSEDLRNGFKQIITSFKRNQRRPTVTQSTPA